MLRLSLAAGPETRAASGPAKPHHLTTPPPRFAFGTPLNDWSYNWVSAISSARRRPIALFSVSSRSVSGTLSATIPAPAWM